ncbi:LptF/LptG family permease [Aliiroseovarius crassostreae]|uniref:LptF/LptG family permease n=1 Tax=Aliiroseovarius crassostreae TaxID=154981 RepID=UPI0021AFF09E|nr:LptF/LptG family permease [Aliiroseovarius crassostreae]UWP90140.1 LptF/LptG family permease [Aliiroseovarius crassostreae]
MSQLLVLFGLAGLVLVLIFWINRAVRLFDYIISSGETALVFLEISTMILPSVIVFVLPIAAFTASVVVINRLNSESELVVAQATGFGPFRLARPVLIFGVMGAAFMLVLTHYLSPKSQLSFAQRQAEISSDVTSRFLIEGSFVHPTSGITLYVREITAEGELLDLFLSDEREKSEGGTLATYTAQRALVLNTAEGPRLLMFDGLAQILSPDGRLTTTGFEEFTYDISALISDPIAGKRKIRQLYTHEMLFPTEALIAETRQSATALRAEAHFRNAQALYVIVAALTGYSMLIAGGFSRFGMWRQVVISIGVVASFQTLDNTMLDIARRTDGALPLIYLASLGGLLFNFTVLWSATRPSFLAIRKRRKAARLLARTTAQEGAA